MVRLYRSLAPAAALSGGELPRVRVLAAIVGSNFGPFAPVRMDLNNGASVRPASGAYAMTSKYSAVQSAMLTVLDRNIGAMNGAIATSIVLCASEVIFPGFVTGSGRNMIDERRTRKEEMVARTSETDAKRNLKRGLRLWERFGETIRGAVETRLEGINDETRARVAIAEAVSTIEINLASVVFAVAGETVEDVPMDATPETLAGKAVYRGIRQQSELDLWLGIAKPKATKDAEEKLREKLAKVVKDKEDIAAAVAAAEEANLPENRLRVLHAMIDAFGKANAPVSMWAELLKHVYNGKAAAEKLAGDNATDITDITPIEPELLALAS